MNNTNPVNGDGLQAFVEKLDELHYDEINALCYIAKKQLLKVQKLEEPNAPSQYIKSLEGLNEEVEQYIKVKKEYLVPYIHSLFEKNETGHDCRNCTGSGSCNIQHEMQLTELKQSHIQLKDLIYRLQMLGLPPYSETSLVPSYNILRNQMAIIESCLSEVFRIEEIYLIPKVAEAQKNIHARA